MFKFEQYCTDVTCFKIVFYTCCALLFLLWGVLVCFEPFIQARCTIPPTGRDYGNPDYLDDPCRRSRFPELFYITREECDFGRRIMSALVAGWVIGWERRQADRPAGNYLCMWCGDARVACGRERP